MTDSDLYLGREQTLVKHIILRKYLERFAHIVGTRWDVITYVDCFSGPWKVRSDELKDSSFAIALEELRKARQTHSDKGRNLRLRCLFLEKNSAAHTQLAAFAKQVTDAEIQTRNCELERAIGDIEAFVKAGGTSSFPFIFIDPKGWSGFAMEKIAPLLKFRPGEVLVNFMTSHIKRFIESPEKVTQASFISLFGSSTFQRRLQGLAKQDREDAAVKEYARNIRNTGEFNYVSVAIVLHPERDQTHFNLIYATRNSKGLEVFKEAEKKAMAAMEGARAEAHKRRRESKSGQTELFDSEVLHDPKYYESLRERFMARSKEQLLQLLRTKDRVLYDEAWALVLEFPLTWDSDLKIWIRDWLRQGHLKLEGKKANQRVPHLHENNVLIWQGPR